MFVTVVIISDLAVTGKSHVSHIPSDVNVEVFSSGVTNVTWFSLFTVHSGASVTPGQKVASVVELIQNWSGSSAQSWEVAPATVAPDFSESDWDVTFTWWAVVPNFSIVSMSPHSTVGEGVDNGFVDVFWDTVSLSFGGERVDEGDFGLSGVVSVDVGFVEVDEFGF